MVRLLAGCCLVRWSCKVQTDKKIEDIVVHYPYANDSFRIRVNDLARNARATDTIHFIYYPDGSLKSGMQMGYTE